MQLANVGQGISLGNFDTCNTWSNPIKAKKLHIWHESQGGYCDCVKCPMFKPENDLFFEWKEHELLTDEQLDQVWNFANGYFEGQIFVHCAAGMGRSPALAVLMKVARGRDFFDSLADVSRATWEQYSQKIIPSWDRRVLECLLDYSYRKR